MTKAYIGIGSNIQPQRFIVMALERLRQTLRICAISPFYRTRAVGTALGQDDFINGMIEIETNLSAHKLKFDVLREIEFELGRLKDMPKHAPRNIDLDLILFGNEIIKDLNVPEPEILERPYVFVPLLDLAPNVMIPGETKALSELLEVNKSDTANCIKGKTLTYLRGTSLKIHDLII